MRISISAGLSVSPQDIFPGDELPPVDVPPVDINDFFELRTFSTSSTTFEPFERLSAEWSIVERSENVLASDYNFSLVGSEGIIHDDISASGVVSFALHSNTLLRIQGRRRGGGMAATVGQGIGLTVDESDCRILEVPSQILNGVVEHGMSGLVSDAASIRRRTYVVPGTLQVAEREVVSTWQLGSIRYDFPLALVLNNMFDGDLDVSLTARFAVDHEDEESYLEVDVAHSSHVDFAAAEDILSFGNTSSVARTANRLMPMILDFVAERIEGQAIQAFFAVLAATSLRETHRLVAVRVVPLENFSYLAIVMCPRREGPDLGSPDNDLREEVRIGGAVNSPIPKDE
ncbi:hypothetical protein KV097_16520 [Mumia sp. zg.B17]|uniref:hypothetical protein n=1 Tax=Mumia sp. zg.B17 TaxID=2855446 RepID=UPI001C6E5F12|nr:hypothetical protein [Mumia sp. zg.B17]MBW9207544.1 hypothetical protein [Mumia sp. zg.B17]